MLSGDVPHNKRLKILENFTSGILDVLVATDVAARGLHIPLLSHVFNYDLSDDAEYHMHRIVITDCAGESGSSISFACEKYALNLPAIEEYVQHSIPVTEYNPNDLMREVTPPKPRFKKRMQSGKSHQKRPSGPRPNRNK